MFSEVLCIFCNDLGWDIGHVYYGSTLKEECDLIPTKIWCFSSGNESRYNLFKVVTESKTIKISEGIIGKTVDVNRGLWVEQREFNDSISRVRIAQSLGIKTALTLPVYLDNKIIAVLEFFSERIVEKDLPTLEILRYLGNLIGYIIERNWAEEALVESETKFKSVFENSLDAIILAEESGLIVGCNEAAKTLFGYDEYEMLGRPIEILMPEEYREAHHNGLTRLKTTGQAKIIGKIVQVNAKTKNNQCFPVFLALTAWKTHKGYFFSGAIRKVTLDSNPENQV